MLATLRGRFDEAAQFIADVEAVGRRVGLADTERLVWTLTAQIAFYRDPAAAPFTADDLLSLARRLPGADKRASRSLPARVGKARLDKSQKLAGNGVAPPTSPPAPG